jgi:type I restriction enzyme, S subunit
VKNNHTPELRFSGFSGDWEQFKLDSIVDRVKSYSLSRDVETIEYTGYKYIHYGDIHTKVADVIDESSNLPNIKAGNYELLEKGDLVLADASEDYQGIATPAVITIDTPYKLVSGLHTIALRPKQVDSLFLYYLINSPTFRKYGYKTGTGMKVFGISVTNLLNFEGMFPLLEEQPKIGNFLKQLDETISLYQQELTTLKQSKQGFLQKMFPKEGKSVPKVRFPGFTGDWEERKLGELVGIRSGWSPSDFVETEEENGELYIKVNDLNYSIREQLDSKMKVKLHNKYSMVKKGSIIFPKRGAAIMTNKIKSLGNDGYMDTNMMALEPNKVDGNFLYTFIEKTGLFKIADTSTIPQINNKHIEPYRIFLPVEQEQTKIGNFFKQLDEIIALHQRELDALKETKKAFLQKMFA